MLRLVIQNFALLLMKLRMFQINSRWQLFYEMLTIRALSKRGFFIMVHITNIFAATLKNAIYVFWSRYAFDIQNICGQGYIMGQAICMDNGIFCMP